MKKLCLLWILCVALPSWASDEELPTDNPVERLVPLKHQDGHRFRRVRKDGELGEEVVFAVENGRVVHLTRHNNHSRKIH